ncbi:hypothetical protein PWG14_20685 (plasmid) [Chromobacterium amazonense]|uniref:hypothetical protein n=1 Tax=Chromobacterium amazonense TaxID=1382803 RepID=UPI00237D35AF|nr:hypothetical protein [Chromobacterium amazonense]MDE1714908.1 hypothetical protein [Chromobacterium amazonense]
MSLHFENYFFQKASLLGEVLYYHLTLEALLTEIIKRERCGPSEQKLIKMMFAKKAEECLKLEKITAKLYEALLALNKVRNHYAHQLDYEITFEATLALAKICGEAGVEFTDGINQCNIDQAKALGYETIELLNAIFRNTFFEVAYSQGEEQWHEFLS